ncbi:hypothetical protein L228DRAFT_159639 [Xylona heveae TC161]|uniref:Uncharacterized protein n=1 Tax=Xylona heveae (strain CBS 132557 / TC161) TaxID=1328760 RepID=A0A165G5T0_XYLHT|nr:hypothetical protein L228DRAFT_159639 [Xylona heveae TC161]KZF21770.1 hypothetical protein L228DRAFT_159639 [Xylona heveae TC161]
MVLFGCSLESDTRYRPTLSGTTVIFNPREELIDLLRALRPSYMARPRINSEFGPSSRKHNRTSSIRCEAGIRTWDGLQKEVMAWFELSERDAFESRPEEQAFLHLVYKGRLLDPEPLDAAQISQTLISLIAAQLLASCSTIFNDPALATLPSALYRDRDNSEAKHISSLRLHSYYKQYPAFGYQARNPSFALAWPALYGGLSPDEQLADELARRRRSMRSMSDESQALSIFPAVSQRAQAKGPMKGQYPARARLSLPASAKTGLKKSVSFDTGVQILGPALSARPASAKHLMIDRHSLADSIPPSRCQMRYAVMDSPGGLFPLEARSLAKKPKGRRKQFRRSSSRVHLASESHPLFIQPIKKLIIRRWRMLRGRRAPSIIANSTPDSSGRTEH